jgi:branched-subunit amino acid ABC-type transport system permease component
VAPLLGWRQFLFIFLVVMVGGVKNIGGVIVSEKATLMSPERR